MKYISLLTMFCFVTAGYASENNYDHIVNMINSRPDTTAERQRVLKEVHRLIYDSSSQMITDKQLRALSILELGYLIRYIDLRTEALERTASPQAKPQNDIIAEKKRLSLLKTMIKSEHAKWGDFCVYNPRTGCREHKYYIYCADRHSADLPSDLRMSIVGAPRNVSEANAS